MDKIGKYKIDGLIGEGGFARVYRAFDPAINRVVAIKVLRIENGAGAEQLLARFRSEAETTVTLHHKNIVTVYDYGEQDGLPYLVMEFLQGRELEQIIVNSEPLSFIEKISLMKQTGEGLQYAHAKGFVHRDVKPANIMVLNDGSVKLMDFGIARLLRDKSPRMTQQGQFMGTFAYMSPEQFEGVDVDSLTDIFAFGVIYYYLLTGRHPFRRTTGNTDLAVLVRNITTLDPPPICPQVSECPPALEEIIFKAIRKDRRQRYQSIEDFQLDVAPILIQLEVKLAEQKTAEGERLLAEGKFEEARRMVREALRLAPGSVAADGLRRKIQQQIETSAIRERCGLLLNQGRDEFESGNYSKAVEAFEAVLRLDPRDTEAGRSLDRALAAHQRIEHANSLFEQAKREVAADNITGAKSVADRFFEEAISLLSDLKIAFPADKVNELAIVTEKAQKERDRRNYLNQELALAQQRISEKAWTAALDVLQPLSVDYAGNNQVEMLLSEAQNGLKVQQKADYIAGIVKEARSLTAEEQFDRAENLLKDGLKRFPNDPILQKAQSTISLARQQYQRQLAIDQARRRARELATAKRFAEAILELEKSIRTWEAPELANLRDQIDGERLAQESAEAKANAHTTIERHITRGQLDEALTLAQQSSKDFPGDASFTALFAPIKAQIAEKNRQDLALELEAVIDKARFFFQKGDFENSLSLIQDGRKRFPNDSQLTGLAKQVEAARADRNRNEAIVEILDTARRLQSAGKLKEAARTLESFLREFPDTREITTPLEQIRLQIAELEEIEWTIAEATRLCGNGQYPGALAILRKALQKYPDSKKLMECQEDSSRQMRLSELEDLVARIERKQLEGELDNAHLQLESALSKFPGEPRLLDLKSGIEREYAASARKAEIEHIAFEAREQIHSKNFKSAIERLEVSLRRFPKEPELAKLLSLAREFFAKEFDEEKREEKVSNTAGEATRMVDSGLRARPVIIREDVSSEVQPQDPQEAQQEAIEPDELHTSVRSKWSSRIVAAVAVLILVALVSYFLHRPAADRVDLHVSSDPPGATLKIGDTTCSDADCVFSLKEGSYDVQATLDGYAPLKKSLVTGGKPASEQLKLEPLPTVINITTNLKSGQVKLDGTFIGSLENGALMNQKVEKGEHDITIEMTAGGGAQLKFSIAPGNMPVLRGWTQVTSLQTLAAATLGRKAQFVSADKDKELLISQKKVGKVSSNPLPLDLTDYGPQDLTVFDTNFSFNGGSTSERAAPILTIFLVSTDKTERNPTRTLQITTGLIGTRVLVSIDGRPNTYTTGADADGTVNIATEIGKHEVSVQKDGYSTSPASRPIFVASGDVNKLLRFELKANPGKLQIVGFPDGTSIFVDKTPRGLLPKNEGIEVDPGKEHQIEVLKGGNRSTPTPVSLGPGELRRLDQTNFTFPTAETPRPGGTTTPPVVTTPTRVTSTINVPQPEPPRASAVDVPPVANPETQASQDWKNIEKQADKVAVQEFIKKYDRSAPIAVAAARLQLAEIDWKFVNMTEQGSLQKFVSDNSASLSPHLKEAQSRINEIKRDIVVINGVLKKYERAFEKSEPDSLKAIFTTAGWSGEEKSYKNLFAGGRSENVQFAPISEPSPRGDTADVIGILKYDSRPRGGNPKKMDPSLTIKLVRDGDQWLIKSTSFKY